MICPQCSSDVPLGQAICPRCYAEIPPKKKWPIGESRVNVAIFMVDDRSGANHGERYQDRVEKYLSDRITSCWFASNEDQLRNICERMEVALLITDADTASERESSIEELQKTHPCILVAIEYSGPFKIPPVPRHRNSILYYQPEEIDDWLLIMDRLLHFSVKVTGEAVLDVERTENTTEVNKTSIG